MELSVQSLACRRGGGSVFSDLSFAVSAGEAAVVRGPNGSGKSSMLRVLAGLTPAAGGAARLGETSLTEDPEAWREKVALAGHLDAVKPVLSVRQNLEFWAALHGSNAPILPALERFGLRQIAEDPAQFCSAGQRRRLGLARLLVIDRPLWLLDEPTVSLDVANVATFAEIVREHCAKGGIALAATHVDIGLPPGPEITLGGTRETADPFLAEGWE
jgi:heme exporter protein A